MIALNLVGTKKNSGTKTFNLNFFKEINSLKGDEDVIVYILKSYLFDKNFKFSNKIKIEAKSDILNNFIIRFFWMQFFLPVELKIKKVKVLFSSSNYSPFLLRILNIKSVLYIHTVLPWLHFDLMPGNKIKNYFIKKFMEISILTSKFIIVPSNYAKLSLIEKLKIEEKKVHVIYLGANHASIKKNFEDIIQNFDYKQKYILSVISCVRYHNILNLLKSYKDFINETNHKMKFVLVLTVLDKKYFYILKNFVKTNFQDEQIIFLPNLENKYLPNLYRNSSLYLFTSYSETFGLTSLEAMNFNIPLLLSGTSSINEINGDIPEYFDPDNIIEIKEKIIKIIDLGSKNYQSDFDFHKKKNHLKKYMWKNTFDKTYEILRLLIN